MDGKKFIILESKNQTLRYLKKIKEFKDFIPITFNIEAEELLMKHNLNFKVGERYGDPSIYKNLEEQSIKLTEEICSKINISYRGIKLPQLFYSDLIYFFISSIKYLRVLKEIKTKEKIEKIIIFNNINLNNELCSKIATEVFKNNSEIIKYSDLPNKNIKFIKFAGHVQNIISKIKVNLVRKKDNRIFFSGNKNIFENVIKELIKNKKNEIFRCNNRLQKSFFVNKKYIPFFKMLGIKTNHQKKLIKDVENFKEEAKNFKFLEDLNLEKELIPIIKKWVFHHLKFKFLEISGIINQMIKLMKKNKIDFIMLDADVNVFEKTFAQVGKMFNIPSIVVQHGVIGNKRGFIPKSADYFLAFGEKSKELLIKAGYLKNDIVITGSPQFDKYFNLEILKKNKKKIVFILSSNSSKNVNPEMEISHQKCKEVYRMLFKSLKKFEGYNLVIKSKGRGELEGLPEIISKEIGLDFQRINLVEKISPIELMKDAEIVIVTDSTMAFDALLLNKKVISIWFKEYEKFFNYKNTPPIKHVIIKKN